MGEPLELVVFFMDEQKYALRLAVVERVVRIVEIVRLPKAPKIILGVINIQGRIIPVVNIRQRFDLPERDIALNDQLIIANTEKRTVALIVDAVDGVMEFPDLKVTSPDQILPSMEYIAGVIKMENGLILVHDINRFLSLEEEQRLEDVLTSKHIE